eukprot:GHVN01103655.1.p1 GENE.GHVN01103655.1~~GHVN01103655.1.p1  ORF type:complete len:553 (+),score=53.73 GHVN01103655.1:428-2086(+)
MGVLATRCGLFERASIDEAYLDVTTETQKEFEALQKQASATLEKKESEVTLLDVLTTGVDEFDDEVTRCDVVRAVNGTPLDFTDASEEERFLALGAVVVYRARNAVKSELNYTLSAGIAHNKMLAKQASAKHKPNMQTVVPHGDINQLLGELSLREIRGLGGKLGRQITSVFPEASSCLDLQVHDSCFLQSKLGEKNGMWLWRACRGIDDASVTPKMKAKSMMASKQFYKGLNDATLNKWLLSLSEELSDRLKADFDNFQRHPKTIVLHINLDNQLASGKARSCRAPPGSESEGVLSAEDIVAVVSQLLEKDVPVEERRRASRLAVGATNFEETGAGGSLKIQSYFSRKPTTREESGEDLPQNETIAPESESLPKDETTTNADPCSVAARCQSACEHDNVLVLSDDDVVVDSVERVGNVRTSLNPQTDAEGTQPQSTDSVPTNPTSEDERPLKKGRVSLKDIWEHSDRINCDQCGESIQAGNMQIHKDFHFAQQIAAGVENLSLKQGSRTAAQTPHSNPSTVTVASARRKRKHDDPGQSLLRWVRSHRPSDE